MCIDCYRIMWGVQQKGSLKNLFQNSPSYHEKGRFYDTPPFCFFMEKYLLKEVVDFRWRDQEYASIVVELCEEFNTKVLLNFISIESNAYQRFNAIFVHFNTIILHFHIKGVYSSKWLSLAARRYIRLKFNSKPM